MKRREDHTEFAPHTAGQPTGKSRRDLVESGASEQLFGARTGLLGTQAVRMGDEFDVLGDRQIAPYSGVRRLIADIAPIDGQAIARATLQSQSAGKEPQQRGLARTVTTDQRRDSTGRECAGEAVQRGLVAESDGWRRADAR